MGAYNVRTLTYKNQTQVRFFKKPIEFDNKKERNSILIYLLDSQCTEQKIRYGISV